jgi:rhodanese-related sulfurtransferase
VRFVAIERAKANGTWDICLLDQGFAVTVSVRGGTGAWTRSGRPLVQ